MNQKPLRTTLAHPTPELPVEDVERAQQHYRDALGFEIGWLYPGSDIGAVSRDNVAIFFRHEHKLASDLSRSPGVRRFLATAGRPAVRSYVVILTAAIA